MGRMILAIGLLVVAVALTIAKTMSRSRIKARHKQLELATEHRDQVAIQRELAAIDAVPSMLRLGSLVAVGLAVVLALWSCVRIVPANNVGIPTNFGTIGSPLSSGLHLTVPWVEVHNFSTRIQELSMLQAPDEGDKAKDDSIEIIAKGGGSMKVDLTVRYSVQQSKADTLFRQAGTMELIKQTFVRPDAREVTRNVFSQYTAEEGYSSKRAEISEQVTKLLAPRLSSRGIVVDSVNVRDVQPEAQVLNAINSILQSRNDALKAAEDQRKQVTEAETRKQVAERDKQATITKAEGDAEAVRINAQGQADANQKLAASLTPELIDLKKTEACADAIAKSGATVINTCGNAQAGASSSSGTTGASTVIVDGRTPG
jgi:regulator of protease activity HflC (stomatin/prohibitin superfamily)